MDGNQGVENTLKVLQGLEDIAVDAKKVLADGKVSLDDLPVAMTLIGQLGEITDAVKAAPAVVPEVKELSAAEVNQIAARVLEMVAKIKAA